LAGNKKDLIPDNREIVLPEKMSKFKRYLTSAKTGHNVSKLFNELTALVLGKIQRG
jgi:50S ribosomal subunit-associated GTPase HflX